MQKKILHRDQPIPSVNMIITPTQLLLTIKILGGLLFWIATKVGICIFLVINYTSLYVIFQALKFWPYLRRMVSVNSNTIENPMTCICCVLR